MFKPLEPLGAAELNEADSLQQLRRARRRAGLAPPPPFFASSTAARCSTTARSSTLHHLRVVDASLDLEGQDHPTFEALKAEYAEVLGRPPPGLPPNRCIELVLKTGNRPRTRPIKLLSEGELAELRRQLHDLLDRGWIQHSTAGHAASVIFARKPDGTWSIRYDYRGLNTITEPLVEPLPHINALLDETVTRRSCWFTKFDLAQGYHQVRLREADWWKTSFRSQLGQFEWKVMPFRLQGSSSVLMHVMNAAMTRGLHSPVAEQQLSTC